MTSISSDSQREFYFSGRTREVAFRQSQLAKLLDILKKNERFVLEALRQDLGKNSYEALITEVIPIYHEIEGMIRNLPRWAKPKKQGNEWWRASQLFAECMIYPEPYGASLIISPWNYPFQLSLTPVATSIAAGNTVLLKPSELSPHSSELIYELISKNFENHFLSVELGGIERSSQLLEQTWDFICFTGSTRVGKIVMEKAAKHLTPILLELGGRCPVFFSETASFEKSVRRVLWAKYVNAGQTCVAPNHLYLPKTLRDRFIRTAEKILSDFYPQKNWQQLSKIVNQKHFKRLTKLLESSEILIGGASDPQAQKLYPTIVDSIDKDSDLETEEIFGPILPVYYYDQFNEIVEQQSRAPKALSIYYFGSDKEEERILLEKTSSGFFVKNDCLTQFANSSIPGGGVGFSGLGKYHGEFGFFSFSHQKAVQLSSITFDSKLRYPPYAKKVSSYLRRFL